MNDSDRAPGAGVTLRVGVAFCAALVFLWTAQVGWTRFSRSDALLFLLYAFLVAHPIRARFAAVGLSLGFPIAAAIISILASGFARTPEAHVPFISYAAANLLVCIIAFKESWASKWLAEPGLWVFAGVGFAYIFICASL